MKFGPDGVDFEHVTPCGRKRRLDLFRGKLEVSFKGTTQIKDLRCGVGRRQHSERISNPAGDDKKEQSGDYLESVHRYSDGKPEVFLRCSIFRRHFSIDKVYLRIVLGSAQDGVGDFWEEMKRMGPPVKGGPAGLEGVFTSVRAFPWQPPSVV